MAKTAPSRKFTRFVNGYYRLKSKNFDPKNPFYTYHSYNAHQICDKAPITAINCTYPLVGCVIEEDNHGIKRGTIAVRAPANRKYNKRVDNRNKWYNVFILG